MKKSISKLMSLFLSLAMMITMVSIGMTASAWSGGTWESTEGISVYVDGTLSGTILYSTIDANKSTSDYTYSSVNTYGTTKTYTGKIYTYDQLMSAAGVTNWSSYSGNTSIKFTAPDGFTASILKSQMTATRYTYSPSTSQVYPAYMKITKSGNTYFKFMFGQLASNDETNSNFVDYLGTNGSSGNGRIDIDTQSTPAQWGAINAYLNGSTTPCSSTINMSTTDKLRFNVYDNSYLNNTIIYYNYGTGNVADPTVYSTLYNIKAPKWCSSSEQGANYPYYLQITAEGTYTLKLFSYGYGKTDSTVYTFTIVVSD